MDTEDSINTHLQSSEIKMVYLYYTKVTWKLKNTLFPNKLKSWTSQKTKTMGFDLQTVNLFYWTEIINKESISEMLQVLQSGRELGGQERYSTANE